MIGNNWSSLYKNLAIWGQRVQKSGSPLRTRFAPSPTGHLHLGHVASALFVQTIAQWLGAEVILRLEDRDRFRVRDPYYRSIVEDLAWLGFTYDRQASPDLTQPCPYRQLGNEERYELALKRLGEEAIYGCDCSRRQIIERYGQTTGELRYLGFCRQRQLDLGRSDLGIRWKIDERDFEFEDGFLGVQRQNPWQQCGDPLLRDRHGCYTYQFAVVADDIFQGVNLIVRGQDLLNSTARQIQLWQSLSSDPVPNVAHHPLICDRSGQKLSKSQGSTAIAQRRASGESAQTLLGEVAHYLGAIETFRPLELPEIIDLSIAGIEAAAPV